MSPEPSPQVAHEYVTSLLDELFGYVDVGNGTALADALATALIKDAKAAGQERQRIFEIDEAALLQAATSLRFGLQQGNHGFTLPMGTPASCLQAGGISIAGDTLVLDAGAPGLHPLQTTRRDAHGPNLELLRKLIARKTRKLACRRLGLPSARTIVNSDERTLLQFAPSSEAGGVVLQRRTHDTGAPRFCAATAKQIDELASSMADDMRALWKQRSRIGRHVDLVRVSANEAILAECGPGATIGVSAIAIELNMQSKEGNPSLYIEYDALDEAFRRGTVIDYLPGRDDAKPENLRRAPNRHRQRTAELEELRSVGASGRIDDIAAAIVTAASGGGAGVLSALSENYDALVTIQTTQGELYATLYWCDGIIKAEAECPKLLDYCQGKLILKNVTLPQTALNTLPGRRLSELAELPFHCDSKIVSGCEIDDSLALDLDVGTMLVNCAEGLISPEPDDPAFGTAWMKLPPPFDFEAWVGSAPDEASEDRP